MSDDDNKNEKAIKKVVKKSVSDVFGEPEQPKPRMTDYGDGWRRDEPYFDKERGRWIDPPYDSGRGYSRHSGGRYADTYQPNTGWSNPQSPMRQRAIRIDEPVDTRKEVNFHPMNWASMRKRVFRDFLNALDDERLVIMPEDHVVLEQVLDEIMRRGLYQVGEPGNAFRTCTLRQLPITVGDSPPAQRVALPASTLPEAEEEWPDDKPEDRPEGEDQPEGEPVKETGNE